MSQSPQHLADGPVRLWEALPDTTLLDWNDRQKKSGVPEPVEVGLDQLPALLPLPSLTSETGCKLANFFEDNSSVLGSHFTLRLHFTILPTRFLMPGL